MMAGLPGLMSADDANCVHWEGARMGRIRVQRCGRCAQLRFPAAPLCSKCGSQASTWVEIGTTGRVLAWCRFHRAYFSEFKDKLPYTVLLVELEGGIRLYANPAAEAGDSMPVIGSTVTAVFEPVNERFGLVKFR